MSANHQKTLDDLEPVILRDLGEKVPDHKQVKPRSRDALRVYDQIQELKLVEKDPLFQ